MHILVCRIATTSGHLIAEYPTAAPGDGLVFISFAATTDSIVRLDVYGSVVLEKRVAVGFWQIRKTAGIDIQPAGALSRISVPFEIHRPISHGNSLIFYSIRGHTNK